MSSIPHPPLTSPPLTLAEQNRMAIYRAAVEAGFYSDWNVGILTDSL